MKKTLLSLTAGLTVLAASALSVTPQRIQGPLGPRFTSGGLFPQENVATAELKSARADGADLSMNYTPASTPYTYTGFQNQRVGMKIAQAFQMTNDVVNQFAGNTLTKIFFYTGVNPNESGQSAVNTIKKATLFLAYDLQDFQPFYTQTVNLPSNGLSLVSFTLNTPYAIEANKPVYVGYYYALSSVNDQTLIIDLVDHGNDVSGGWCGIQDVASTSNPNPEWYFDNITEQVGFLCIGATITGPSLPQNAVSVLATQVQPTAYQNDQFPFLFLFQNDAANTVSSIEAEVKVGDNPPASVSMTVDDLAYNDMEVAQISGLSHDVAALEYLPVTVTVTKVNGNANTSAQASGTAEIQILPTGKGFNRNVVVEEFTGTWCKWCPQGIITMEKLRDTYTDGSVIPVGIHSEDEMAAASFQSIIRNYCSGNYPSAVMNRYMGITNIYPPEKCIEEIEEFQSYPAPATVSATARLNANRDGIIFDTKTSFTFDNPAASQDYILAFAVTEDNVGPYEQQNGLSGSGIAGWTDKPSVVETMYNDVARQYDTNRGISGSIPAQVEYGKEYSFSYEMKFLASTTIANPDNLNGIVYLLNKQTGAVENACLVKASEVGAVDNVLEDNIDPNLPVEYFNLQGIRVTEPTHGLYIRRQGNKAEIVPVR